MMYGFPQKPIPKRVMERHHAIPGNATYLFQRLADPRFPVHAIGANGNTTAPLSANYGLYRDIVVPPNPITSDMVLSSEASNPMNAFDGSLVSSMDLNYYRSGYARVDLGADVPVSEVHLDYKMNASTGILRLLTQITGGSESLHWQVGVSANQNPLSVRMPMGVTARYLYLRASRSGSISTSAVANIYRWSIWYAAEREDPVQGVIFYDTPGSSEIVFTYTPLGAML